MGHGLEGFNRFTLILIASLCLDFDGFLGALFVSFLTTRGTKEVAEGTEIGAERLSC